MDLGVHCLAKPPSLPSSKIFSPFRLCAFARDYSELVVALPRWALRGEKRFCRVRLRTVARN